MQLIAIEIFNSSCIKYNNFALLVVIVMEKNSEDCVIKNQITYTTSDIQFLEKGQSDAGLSINDARRSSCWGN